MQSWLGHSEATSCFLTWPTVYTECYFSPWVLIPTSFLIFFSWNVKVFYGLLFCSLLNALGLQAVWDFSTLAQVLWNSKFRNHGWKCVEEKKNKGWGEKSFGFAESLPKEKTPCIVQSLLPSESKFPQYACLFFDRGEPQIVISATPPPPAFGNLSWLVL